MRFAARDWNVNIWIIVEGEREFQTEFEKVLKIFSKRYNILNLHAHLVNNTVDQLLDLRKIPEIKRANRAAFEMILLKNDGDPKLRAENGTPWIVSNESEGCSICPMLRNVNRIIC